MIGSESFCFECKQSKNSKNNQCYNFLHDLKLPKVEWPTIASITYLISRNLKTIFKKSNSPTNKNNRNKSKLG